MRAILVAATMLWSLAAPALAADSAAIVMYHRFGDGRHPSTNIRLDQFDAHLKILKEGGHVVLPLPEIVDALAAGRELPDRAVAITIDDAWASVWTHAWPRLKAAGLPFTLFVVTDETDRGGPEMMTWDQIREIAASGLATIGTQGAAHPHMDVMGRDAVAADLAKARRRLNDELGREPNLFAWPFGEASLDAAEAFAAAGFVAGFGQHSGIAWAGTPFWYLPRFAMNEAYGDAARFRTAINAVPLKATGIAPADPRRAKGDPAPISFTLAEPDQAKGLGCYTPQGRAETRIDGARVTVTPPGSFPVGRQRINCTAPAEDGRWRWFGWQFTFR